MSSHISGENLHIYQGRLLLCWGREQTQESRNRWWSYQKTLFSNIISLLLPSLAFLYRERGSKAVQATCSWDKVPTQPTGSAQCYNIIGNHFCQYGVSMWERSLQYSSHRKLQGGSSTTLVAFGDFIFFFLYFCKYFCSRFISIHTRSDKPLELCIQMWRWKITEKDKNIFCLLVWDLDFENRGVNCSCSEWTEN